MHEMHGKIPCHRNCSFTMVRCIKGASLAGDGMQSEVVLLVPVWHHHVLLI